MAMTIRLEIVSAEAGIFSGSVNTVYATAVEGELGIMHDHAQLLTRLKPGNVRAELPNGDEAVFYVSGGILEVQPDVVTILADSVVRAEDIDEQAALEAQEHAQKAMREQANKLEYTEALVALTQASAQLQALRKLREKMGH